MNCEYNREMDVHVKLTRLTIQQQMYIFFYIFFSVTLTSNTTPFGALSGYLSFIFGALSGYLLFIFGALSGYPSFIFGALSGYPSFIFGHTIIRKIYLPIQK
jgi:hypothetical protein